MLMLNVYLIILFDLLSRSAFSHKSLQKFRAETIFESSPSGTRPISSG